MSEKKLGSEPAFAGIKRKVPNPQSGMPEIITYNKGVSKRFYAACAAMQGLLSRESGSRNTDIIIKDAYEFADKLLELENEV